MSDYLPYLIAGITTGSIYGLTAMGLVLSYKTSGIFNFAHGGVAAAAAYLFYTLHVQHGMAWPLAALLCVGVGGPLIGLVLERIGRLLADVPPARKVVGTIGLLLAIQGTIAVVYGSDLRSTPQFLPTSRFSVAGTYVDYAQLIVVLFSVAAAVGLFVFFRSTRLGVAMRGVVDDPSLLALTATSPARVRTAAWVISSCFAAASGILIAPTLGLEPLLLTLLVVQAFGAAAIGAFSSLPITFAGGLVVGLASALLSKWVVSAPGLVGLPSSVPFLILFFVLLAMPKRKLVQAGARVRASVPERSPVPARARLPFSLVALIVLVGIPQVVGARLPVFTSALTYVLVFLSLGLLVWTSGQVSLCHAAFAAVGAAAFGQITSQLNVPWPVALVLAGLVTVPVGAVVAIPAIRLSGLYLALATFGFGILVQRVGYPAEFLFGSSGSREVPRPGVSWLSTDKGYYYVVLAVVLLACLMVWAVYHSRLGLLLRGLSDSPLALSTMGTSVNVTRVLVFCLSAFLAGVAGGLFGGALGTVTGVSFGPFESLTWLTVLALAGTAPFGGPFLAAALLAVAPSYVPDNWVQYQTLAFGVLALVVSLQLPQRYDLRGRLARAARETTRRREASPLRSRPLPVPAPEATS
jgi:branched-subunit amino acid ABC-type transport system permease component